ncbi:MAG: CRISPR system precrRNA processing endoribonuclease RAMP protein Cas6, partial [Helicobacteraceae bacterium]|nr:CRISPR system precrRNA processing endoribonuclease RAMP protein Cas6 [Helicobacteraceae bacterium]
MLDFIRIEAFARGDNAPSHEFLGSALRGAFGAALKRTSCVNPKYRCGEPDDDRQFDSACQAAANCLYDEFFIQKNDYHPYRFSKPIGENNYNFAFYLFGGVCKKLPYILNALYEMVCSYGLGRDRQKLDIEKIVCNDRIVYENGAFNLEGVKTKRFEAPDLTSRIKLRFVTPLRMKSDNKLLTSKPQLRQILFSILDRLNHFNGMPTTKLPFEPQYKEGKSDVTFKDLTRFSSRQNTKMRFGGITGYVEYDEIDPKSYTILKLGE